MDNTRVIQLVILSLSMLCFGVAYAIPEQESKNGHLLPTPVYSKDLTLSGDARVLCWYGTHEQMGEGMFCFIQPHDNMIFIDTPREAPPTKKSPTNSSPSSSSKPHNTTFSAHFTY